MLQNDSLKDIRYIDQKLCQNLNAASKAFHTSYF